MAIQFQSADRLSLSTMEEAATAGLESFDRLLRLFSAADSTVDYRDLADYTVGKFTKVISVLNRSGHARFRRGPPPAPAESPAPAPEIRSAAEKIATKCVVSATEGSTTSRNSSASVLSTVTTGDGSVTNGKSLAIAPIPISSGKPPIPPRKRCHDNISVAKTHSGAAGGSCHCNKKRKKFKKTIRVPAISSKIADIPQDNHSWRKYGQKPIKGSPFPRGYYRCSSGKNCPARKQVERARDDPTMLIVTYVELEHNHSISAVAATTTELLS